MEPIVIETDRTSHQLEHVDGDYRVAMEVIITNRLARPVFLQRM